MLLHVSHESSWLVLKHLKGAHADGSCSPRCRSLCALIKRRAATSSVRSQRPTLTASPHRARGRVHRCSWFAHTSHSTSPPKAGQMWSTQTVLHSRQSDRTPIGLILSGAQDTVSISRRPFGVCLFLPLRNGGRLDPRFCTAQQGHPGLILTDRSHHEMADGLHSCSSCLRKSEKNGVVAARKQLPQPLSKAGGGSYGN